MKVLLLSTLTLLFTINSQAQNTNVKSEVKTTTKTIKDSKGEKKIVKTEEIKEVQKIKLEEAKANSLNIPMKADQEVDVTKKTKLAVDGVTQFVDVDRSAYYTFNGQKYQVAIDKSGYTMAIPDNQERAVLRRTSNNNYIYKNKDKLSVGYFDAEGNLVLETYDEKTDTVVLEKFIVVKP
ncbi:hypothetical protein IVB69_05485 [Flavobacterium sp. J49]|uniref:hypothetical protein n=1 Tax=Flavobacterium sp. J49 TaxID=2718534 RepID=UPI00159499EB|nr:hypothetical protein [Flavobacterium sp. J49]MBF6640923.1 hypothetical protein [Flavobacterium sp. J49]NIC02170.1 hypothetical protein [Flavobacterium sp. J49]